MAHQRDNLRTTQHFTVTEEHLALLRRTHISEGINGSATVDPKRPYGNSNVYRDIAETLGIKPEVTYDWDEPELSDRQIEYLERIHQEVGVALQILVTNLEIHVGDYVRDSPYVSSGWTPVKEESK